MKLNEFIEENEISNADLAKGIGVTPVTVSRYLNDKRLPDKETMSRIYAFTNGQVTPNDFYGVPTGSAA